MSRVSKYEGCHIMANNGQFLGTITRDKNVEDFILNTSGPYGCIYSATSIMNAYSSYGSTYSLLSPFNPYTFTPPALHNVEGDTVALLTVNQNISGEQVDPHELLEWVKAHLS